MRAGCFAEKRVIDLLNRRFVPYFFNRGGPGKGHDKAAHKFATGKTKNPYAYFAVFTPEGKYLSESDIYANKDDVFKWLKKQLADHPEYAAPTEYEKQILSEAKDATKNSPMRASAATLLEELGEYKKAKAYYRGMATAKGDSEAACEARLALLRIARYQKRWKEHTKQEERLRKLDTGGEHAVDLTMERAHRLLAKKKYQKARDLLQPLSRTTAATSSPRLAEIHFHAGVACWFLKDRDWAKFHWCWIVKQLPEDRFYMRAYVAAAAEIMPYPNPELGNYKARGMIGTQHIVQEVRRSMRIYKKLKLRFERGELTS